MFDIGGSELLVIAVVALVVLGPKELPTAVRSIQGVVRKARELARDFQAGLGEMAREIELDKMKAEVKSALDSTEVDSIGHSIRQEFTSATDELKKTFDPDSLTTPAPINPPSADALAASGAPVPLPAPEPEPEPVTVDAAPPEALPEPLSPSAPPPKPGA